VSIWQIPDAPHREQVSSYFYREKELGGYSVADFRTEYQRVYEAIRDAIVDGEYKPGERLPQRQLATKYNSTVITVREAMRYLESSGLVFIEPKWGAMVQEITPESIRARYAVREALEGMAARIAASNMTEAERNELLGLAEHCDSALRQDSLTRREKASVHYELHERIAQISRNTELIRSLQRLSLQTIILSNAYHIDWSSEAAQKHKELVIAIASGDPDMAEREMRAHVRSGCTMETTALQRGHVNP
jgi:DNA-binding GntR family transcriptional regulator